MGNIIHGYDGEKNECPTNYTNVQMSYAEQEIITRRVTKNTLDQLVQKMVNDYNSFRGTEYLSWLFTTQSQAVSHETSFVSGFDRPHD